MQLKLLHSFSFLEGPMHNWFGVTVKIGVMIIVIIIMVAVGSKAASITGE